MTSPSSRLSAIGIPVAQASASSNTVVAPLAAQKRTNALRTAMDASQAASCPLTSRTALTALASHPDVNVRFDVMTNESLDDAGRMRFLADESWYIRTNAIDWNRMVSLDKLVVMLRDESPLVRERAALAVRGRSVELLAAAPALISEALVSLPEAALHQWKRWRAQPESILHAALPASIAKILARWCTAVDPQVAARSIAIARRWVRTGCAVLCKANSNSCGGRRDERRDALMDALEERIAEGSLDEDAQRRAIGLRDGLRPARRRLKAHSPIQTIDQIDLFSGLAVAPSNRERSTHNASLPHGTKPPADSYAARSHACGACPDSTT